MDRRDRTFIGVALGVTVLLAVLVAPFASTKPDGLEHVLAQNDVTVSEPAKKSESDSPFVGYQVPAVEDEKKMIAITGVIGLAVMFFGSYAIAKMMLRAKRRDDEHPRS